MNLDEPFATGLALLALGCYAVLFALRVVRDPRGSRLLYIDLLLLVAAVEIVADDLRLTDLALITRGAFLAGGIALLAAEGDRRRQER